MTTLRLILGDQLSHSITSLEGYDSAKDIILMCEVWDEASYVKHHKKKIAFLFVMLDIARLVPYFTHENDIVSRVVAFKTCN